MVGTSGGSFNGLPLLAAKMVVACTSDRTKNECQCVCVRVFFHVRYMCEDRVRKIGRKSGREGRNKKKVMALN